MTGETRCPVCGERVTWFVAPGPETGRVGPCGHDVHPGFILGRDATADSEQSAADGDHSCNGNDETSAADVPTDPNDVETAYIVRQSTRSWTLHVDQACERLQQTDHGSKAVDPETFPEREWCSVCSPWLEPSRSAEQDWSTQNRLRNADLNLIDDPREDPE